MFRIVDRASLLLSDRAAYSLHQIDRSPYGDGQAAARIVDLMLRQGWQKDVMPEHTSQSERAQGGVSRAEFIPLQIAVCATPFALFVARRKPTG